MLLFMRMYILRAQDTPQTLKILIMIALLRSMPVIVSGDVSGHLYSLAVYIFM
jgi:hypothetical protein